VAKKDEINLLKALISNAQKSTDSIVIALGKESAKYLKQKNIDFSALRSIKTKDGFEAYLNIHIEKLTHSAISQKILDGIPYKEAIKQKNQPYLNGSPELILKMPLETTEEEKRNFLQTVSKSYKDLIKEITPDGKIIKHKDIKAEWGVKSGRKEGLILLMLWIKNRYKKLKKDKRLMKYYGRFYKIKEEIKNMEFGGIKNPDLSIERIKALNYSKITG